MCVGPFAAVQKAVSVATKKEDRNDAPVVTGKQKDVEAPIDTSKVTARLKKKRSDESFKEGQRIVSGKGRSPNDLKII
tara:strand:+ start:420 stop:653 length:234 start_codon:yes stop_codon:yes gene_type:complete